MKATEENSDANMHGVHKHSEMLELLHLNNQKKSKGFSGKGGFQ